MRAFRPTLLLVLIPFAIASTCGQGPPELELELPAAAPQPLASSQLEAARDIVGKRCVVCHGCYDAPCQLVLSSRDGLKRGASKAPVYRAARLLAAQPTRLDFDAETVGGWRGLGFFDVSSGHDDSTASLLLEMLALGRAHTFEPERPLPGDLPLSSDRKLTCPTLAEFPAYAAKAPKGGMPYGMAPLSGDEYQLLGGWAAADAPTLPTRPLAAGLAAEVDETERLLNDPGLERRVVARYLYEHWVFAHLYFPSHPNGPFFEVVRSKTPPGEAIRVIATRFPYDDPGVEEFWYRLRRLDQQIVHKTHITYELGADRRARIEELFFGEEWKASGFPSWKTHEASNPFIAFAEIPARARYLFMLDDAEYFVRSFIRGPVCRGQAATDVIQDRFFVSFLDPEHDIAITDPGFLPSVSKDLRLPADSGANLSLLEAWKGFDRSQTRYRKERFEAYERALDGRGTRLDMIWDGNDDNRSAMLTVFRNADNATVLGGFVGDIPKTAWVMDYPVFERIYYDLVTGFDVFGNVGHQLGVRLYMDNLRMESEDLFLAFLPQEAREPMRDSWYVGATEQTKYLKINPLRSQGIPSEIPYESDDPKRELIEMLLARHPAVSGPPDLINRCDSTSGCARPGASALERRAEETLRPLVGLRGEFAGGLPEVVPLRVRGTNDDAVAYTLMLDRAFTNVAAMFREEQRQVPEEDAVTIIRGVIGSYPNFMFDVGVNELPEFVAALTAIQQPAQIGALAERWGVRRSSLRFWETMDWLHDELVRQNPREAGLLDLNRYQNL